MLTLELNRSTENTEPLLLKDFCFFGDNIEKPRPSNAAGAALLRLIELELLPAFALDGPWLADLEAEGKGIEPPTRLCWASEDAILLAPHRADEYHYGGFLIAKLTANGQVRKFYSNSGESITLKIPNNTVNTNAFSAAISDAMLEIV